LLDSAHNIEGLTATGEALRRMGRPLRLIYATVSDKDVEGALACLPEAAGHHWCAADVPRAMPVDELADRAAVLGRMGDRHHSVEAALEVALAVRKGSELIVVLGSVFTVGEALAHLDGMHG
jgi:dihydrofolate synthase/folylpolyglutamate synthase